MKSSYSPYSSTRLEKKNLRLAATLISLLLSACGTQTSEAPPPGVPLAPVDPSQVTLYYNGTILTMESDRPIVEAMGTKGEEIVAVGSEEEILALADETATRIDLDGQTLMPGFVDAHTHILNDHLSQGMSLDRAQMIALKNGITTLGTLYVDQNFLEEIKDFDEAGLLHVRTNLYLTAADPCGRERGNWWKEHAITQEPGEMLHIAGVKIYTDGGVCGKVALSFELEPGWGTGDLWYSQDELNEMVAEIHKAGYQAAIHAIGDRAVEQGLNAIEYVLDGEPNTLRHRMEHVSVIAPDQIARFGELGVIPVLMGEFPNCTPYGPPVPEVYGHMEWPWRALREANPDLPLAWHSDVPFQSNNPFEHLLGFVTRIDRLGTEVCPPAEWLVENTLTVEEALSIMTIQSAYSLNREKEIGSLAPGKFADFIVIEKNPLDSAPEDLADNQIMLTVVGGRVEYCRPPNTELCPGFYNRNPAPLPDMRPPESVWWITASLLIAIPLGIMLLRKRALNIIRVVGSLAGITAGLGWVWGYFFPNQLANETTGFLFLSGTTFLMTLGVISLAVINPPGRFRSASIWLALAGAITMSVSGIAVEWFRSENGWGMFLGGLLGQALGLFLFGTANLRTQIFPRWNAIPLIAGLIGGLAQVSLGFILPENSDLPFTLMVIGLGVGWVLMSGLILLSPLPDDPI